MRQAERPIIEEQLNREQEQRYEDLESFIYMISHELKTSVREIKLYTEFIAEDNAERLRSESIDDLRAIERVCNNMLISFQKMIEYSRAGFKTLNLKQISMRRLVLQCHAELMKGMPDKEIELIVDDLPDLTGDIFLMKLCITNLL